MILLCDRCGEHPAKYDIDDRGICEACYSEYTNCIQCGGLVHESEGYPVYNGKEYGKGFIGLEGIRCENCHGGC